MLLRMRLRSAVMSVLFVVAFAAFASGATYYVATAAAGGSDSNPGTAAQPWATIQNAVDTIANGDTIIVKNGTYVGARISNSGSSLSPKTLQAENKWGAKINVPQPTRNRRNGNLELGIFAGDGPPVSYWVIDGFEVDGQLLYRCIDIVGQGGSAPANHITIKNCHVHHAKNGTGVSTGIFDGSHSYALYENNITHNNTEHGMYHSNSSDYAVIRGNTSYSNAGCGFHNNGDLVGAGAPGRIRYVLYEKNIAYANGGGAGINCGGEHFSVYRNNLLYGNLGNGFTFYGKGESDTSSHDNRIYNNTVVMPSNGRYAALLADSANNNWFYNNILHNSNSAGKGSFTIDKPNITGFQSDYNVVMADGFNIDAEYNDHIGGTTLAQWQAFGYDTHSITATLAELFVNPGANDYRLKAGSPAIDVGTDLSTAGGSPVDASVTDDIEGRARPVGAAFDIGCYEYSNQPTVETPVFTPPAGSYSPSVDVTITSATVGADIYYTTNGAEPTQSSSLYTAPVSISSTTTLKARAFKAAMDASAIASGVYTISLPQTEITIQEGTAGYNSWEDTWIEEDNPTTAHYAEEIFHLQWSTQDRQLHRFSLSPVPAGVEITSATLYIYQQVLNPVSGSPTISAYRILTHWVENQATYNKRTSANNWGTPGMLAGTDYDATPVSTTGVIAAGTTGWVGIDVTGLVNGWYTGSYTNEGVMLKCAANGHLRTYSTKRDPVDQRPKLVLSYQLPVTKVATPTFDPAPGTYVGSVDVSLSCTTAGAEIRYTLDGSNPTDTSALYSAPIHIATTMEVRACGFKAGMDPSDVASGVYEISGTIAAPTFSPPAGTYNSAQDVTISCATFGATIHYTINGSAPNGASPVYSSPVHVATTTIKAIATKSGAPDSSVSTALYRIDAQAPAVSNVATVPTSVKAGIDLTITLTASATDASTGNSSITAAECFIGADPGTGHGTAMNAADGAFDSPTEALIVSIDCSSWSPPTSVRLNVRARDAAGNWSTVQFLLVPVVSAVPPGAVRDLTISPDTAYLKAPLAVVSFSSQAPSLPAANLVDSDARTCWQSAGTATREEEHVTVDLGSVESIAAVAVCVGKTVALFPTEFTIAVSSDLSSWDEVAAAKSFKATGSKRFVWQFEPVDARYVKISGPGNYNRREGEYAWQLGEIEVPMSLATSWAVLQWTAPADDGYTGPSAAEYDVRYSQVPILAANFAAATSVPGIGAPSIPGTRESFNADMGDLVGNIFVALKTVDSMDNWSALSNVATGRIGGARILGTYPDDATELDADFKPVFFFAAGGSIKSLAAVISSSPDFPFASVPRPSGERDTTVRFGLSAKSNSWKVSPGQWKKIKETSLSDGVLHWRIEGKAVIDKLPTVLFSPTRSVYFDLGSIDNLHADPSHAAGTDQAVWPAAEIAPAFSWTNNSPISQYFFIDVSTLPNVPLSDKRNTFTLGGKGIALTSYQTTAADWKKLRKLAGSTNDGALHWRVRGTDADKALSAASSPQKLVVDSGQWTLTSLPSLSTVPPAITWTHVGEGIVAYSLQFSVEDDFPASARYSLKVPAKSLTAMTYTLSPAEITRLAKLAQRNGVTSLYYRVRGEDSQKMYVGYSPAQTTAAP